MLTSWVVQTLASSAVAILGFIAIKSTGFGERFLDHHLQRRIADLRHAHEEKIESIRSELAQLQDRGRRANELEFDAASKIWHAFVDAYLKTRQAIVDYKTFPDLNRVTEEDLAAFLGTTDLSEAQRKQVLSASDKVAMFSKITSMRAINTAGATIYDGRLLLMTNGIFIPAETGAAFKSAFDFLSTAQVEQLVEFQHGSRVEPQCSFDLVGAKGDSLFQSLETMIRTALRRNREAERPPI